MDHFINDIHPAADPKQACCLYFNNDSIALVKFTNNEVKFPLYGADSNTLPDLSDHLYIGHSGLTHYYARTVTENEPYTEGMLFKPLRSLYGTLKESMIFLLMLAKHIASWDKQTVFCGCCGNQTQNAPHERAKVCPACKLTVYPSPMPAIITAVIRDNRILLARHSRFSQLFTVLAGFVNAGETLEECVAREIKEEVNIEVANIRYMISQPWGISQALMVGFIADYAGGEIETDNNEIIEADWFTANRLPDYPHGPGLANKLIQFFIDNYS